MDFANEFSDLSVGDAWSPEFESEGGGHSVMLTRSKEMEQIIQKMCDSGILTATEIDPLKACDMHGHMLDFKKRGSYIRNQWRHRHGKNAPDFGLRPSSITRSRRLAECVISMIFVLAGTRFSRACVSRIPERILGPLFNGLRMTWKRASRPTKRKGLAGLQMIAENEK
jgi:coenzyme F420 hydrogenase subunit beta